ncbi:MAG: heparinase II/III family protein [Candidatus Omnitrophica bacterium]|nr:heparinase II/III family protein [Candidatus Omnitrophota bacterium]
MKSQIRKKIKFVVNMFHGISRTFFCRLINPIIIDKKYGKLLSRAFYDCDWSMGIRKELLKLQLGYAQESVCIKDQLCHLEKKIILDEADDICIGRIKIFGDNSINIKNRINWHRDYFKSVNWPKLCSEYIDIDNFRKGIDVKNVWELNRHQHLVTLAKAYRITGHKKYSIKITEQIEDWIRANPVEVGVNWKSGLEISLRVMSWIYALSCIVEDGVVNEQFLLKFHKSIYTQASYIAQNLSNKSYPNNHLIGEALALFIVGVVFPSFSKPNGWGKKGFELLEEQSKLQFFKDGSNKEQAIGYHRFVLEFYTLYLVLCEYYDIEVSTDLMKRIEKMYVFLMYSIKPDGSYVGFGDNDSAKVATFSERSNIDTRLLLSIGAAIFARGDMKKVAGKLGSDFIWLMAPKNCKEFFSLEVKDPIYKSIAFIDCGMYIMRSSWSKESLYLCFDCGPQGWGEAGHGHADALSFEINAYGERLLIDPGTFIYNGADKWRNFFRGTKAHNTVVVDNEDQSKVLNDEDPFGWAVRADGKCSIWVSTDNFDLVEGIHDGYLKLADPVGHKRKIFFVKHEYWIVDDFLICQGEHQYDIYFHFPPEVIAKLSDQTLEVVNVKAQMLLMPVEKEARKAEIFEGAENPIQGWVSCSYGQKMKAPALKYSKKVIGSTRFSTLLYPFRPSSKPLIKIKQVNCNNEKNIKVDNSSCYEIKIDSFTDFLLFSDLQKSEKKFSKFRTDAAFLYLRLDSNDCLVSIFMSEGSFLKIEEAMIFNSDKFLSWVEVDFKKFSTIVLIPTGSTLRLFLKATDAVGTGVTDAKICFMGDHFLVEN